MLSPSNISELRTLWVGKVPLDIMSNVLVVGGRVFGAGSVQGSDPSTALVAFDRANGNVLWRAEQPFANVVTRIAEDSGRVFISTIDDHKLRAYAGATGDLLWTLQASGGVGPPTISHSSVYVQTNAGQLFRLDPETGRIMWSADYGGDNTVGGPAVFHGRLFISGDSSHQVGAFDVLNGTPLWTVTLGNEFPMGSPAIDRSRVFVGTRTPGSPFDTGGLYALDAVTGHVLWHVAVPAVVVSTPAIANGIVYFGDNDGDLFAYRETDGTQLWTAHTRRSFVLSSPIVANGVVYVATLGAYAYDALTGALLWSKKTDIVNTAPSLVDGVLYVPDFSGRLRAYGLPDLARSDQAHAEVDAWAQPTD